MPTIPATDTSKKSYGELVPSDQMAAALIWKPEIVIRTALGCPLDGS
jgi:hypothetical protein